MDEQVATYVCIGIFALVLLTSFIYSKVRAKGNEKPSAYVQVMDEIDEMCGGGQSRRDVDSVFGLLPFKLLWAFRPSADEKRRDARCSSAGDARNGSAQAASSKKPRKK